MDMREPTLEEELQDDTQPPLGGNIMLYPKGPEEIGFPEGLGPEDIRERAVNTNQNCSEARKDDENESQDATSH